jgi:hypothetical protein
MLHFYGNILDKVSPSFPPLYSHIQTVASDEVNTNSDAHACRASVVPTSMADSVHTCVGELRPIGQAFSSKLRRVARWGDVHLQPCPHDGAAFRLSSSTVVSCSPPPFLPAGSDHRARCDTVVVAIVVSSNRWPRQRLTTLHHPPTLLIASYLPPFPCFFFMTGHRALAANQRHYSLALHERVAPGGPDGGRRPRGAATPGVAAPVTEKSSW